MRIGGTTSAVYPPRLPIGYQAPLPGNPVHVLQTDKLYDELALHIPIIDVCGRPSKPPNLKHGLGKLTRSTVAKQAARMKEKLNCCTHGVA